MGLRLGRSELREGSEREQGQVISGFSEIAAQELNKRMPHGLGKRKHGDMGERNAKMERTQTKNVVLAKVSRRAFPLALDRAL